MSFPGRLEATLEEHRNIVEAIAMGDVKAASKAAECHMEHSEQTLLKAMEARKRRAEKEARKAKKKAVQEES